MVLVFAVGIVGVVFVVRTTVVVTVVIFVVGIVRINGVLCFEQRCCAFVRVGVIITVAITTAFIISIFPGIAAVVGVVSSTFRLAVNIIHMSASP